MTVAYGPTFAAMIRPATPADKAAILDIAVDCGLFPAEHVGELGAMMDDQLGAEAEGHHWIVEADGAGQVLAAAYSEAGPLHPISS